MHVIGSREEGGVERLYLRLTAALAQQGEEVLCVLRPSSVLVQRLHSDLPRELVRMRSVFDPFARARLASVARGFGAQIVQPTWVGPPGSCGLTRVALQASFTWQGSGRTEM